MTFSNSVLCEKLEGGGLSEIVHKLFPDCDKLDHFSFIKVMYKRDTVHYKNDCR